MEPGIYYGLEADKYFAIKAFSKSMVASTMRSAKHLKHYLATDYKSAAMVTGSLVDALLLDPKELEKFTILPETYINSKNKEMPFTMQSKTCKETYTKMIADGFTPIKQADMDKAKEIADGVMDNTAAATLLKNAKTQVALVWIDKETGLKCKSRIDAMTSNTLIDLKTTRNAQLRPFSRDIVNLGYHTQAGMYLDGWRALNDGTELQWHFIAVENEAPYCCAVYELDSESIECGRIRFQTALQKYKGYLENDPDLLKGYSDFVEPISVPTWEIETAFKEGDENDCGI